LGERDGIEEPIFNNSEHKKRPDCQVKRQWAFFVFLKVKVNISFAAKVWGIITLMILKRKISN
jgi:hypothetical protein